MRQTIGQSDDAGPSRTKQHFCLATAIVSVMIFSCLAFYQVRLPGLYYDEAADVVPAMQLLRGDDVQLARGVGISLAGRDFPVMIGDYWGVVSTYAVLPLFALFGVGVFPIRLWTIGAGMLAVFLTYRLGSKLYSPEVGATSSLLLAVFPSFLLWARTGIYVISHIITIVLGIMLSFIRWRETRKRRWLLLAAWLTGIGLSTKLLFVWFLLAAPASYVLVLVTDWILVDRHACSDWREIPALLRRRVLTDIPIRSIGDPIVAGLGFMIGAFPVIYYNLVSQGSYLVFRANLSTTERGVDNFALWENFKTELNALQVVLEGGYFWYYGGIYKNVAYPWIAACCLAGMIALTVGTEQFARYRRVTLFLAGFAIVVFFLSLFSVSILAATHLLILIPIPQLMIAGCLWFGSRWLTEKISAGIGLRKMPGIFAALIAAILLIGDLRVDIRYHQALAKSGGYSSFSSAIYSLADELDAQDVNQPYALDWGFKYPIMILTNGRVEPLEIYGTTYEPGPDFEAALRDALEDPSPVFISHDEEASSVPRLDAFRQIIADSGRAIVDQQTIRQLDGKQVYYVFRVE